MEQQFNNPFEGANIDPVLGSKMMSTLGITPLDLSAPDKFNKLQDILKYIGNKQGGDYLLSKITSGDTKDKLGKAWEYINLRSKHDNLKFEIEKLSQELELYER
jgi:hypothetical protein